jgi:hypothetical protein
MDRLITLNHQILKRVMSSSAIKGRPNLQLIKAKNKKTANISYNLTMKTLVRKSRIIYRGLT